MLNSNTVFDAINIKNILMILDERLLRAFKAVAEELHFGRAAQRLHISQPPLSLSIRQLEEQLGVSLFIRTTRSVQLTPAGAQLLRSLADIEQVHQQAVTAVQQAASGLSGELSVALTPSATYTPIPRALRAFRAQYPQVHLDLREMNSRHMAQLLLSGQLDLALARPLITSTALQSRPIYHEPLVFCVPHGHPLALREAVTVEQIRDSELIGYSSSESIYFHDLLKELLGPDGAEHPRTGLRTIIPTILLLVESGFGTAVVPQSLNRLRAENLSYVPIANDRGLGAQLSAVHRTGETTPALDGFLHLLESFL